VSASWWNTPNYDLQGILVARTGNSHGMLRTAMAQTPFVAHPVQPTFWITDWNGRSIQAAQSRGGVIAVADFSDNLMRADSLWPSAAVVQKSYRDKNHETAFSEDALKVLTRRLGFYTNLQSLHSEDAITWSFFGTLAAAPPLTRVTFLNWLLSHIGLRANEENCAIDLWRRIPHPDTQGGMGGPEIDCMLLGSHSVLFGESKWRSPEGRLQGLNLDKTQLQLRKEFCEGIAQRIFGERQLVVLSVFWRSPLPIDLLCGGVATVRSISWEDLANYSGHPSATEFHRYYEWKQRWSKK
jgi:hypothetical protein